MNLFGEITAPPPSRSSLRAEARRLRSLREFTTDGLIAASWSLGFDTATAARMLQLPESLVANRLAAIRDGAHA